MINPHQDSRLEYVKPGTLAEACKFLEQHEGKPVLSPAEQIVSSPARWCTETRVSR